MFVIISYDIVEDKRRNKISKMLENYGTRVQFSVFECLIDALQLKTIKEFAESILETSADSMRYYILCESCLKKVDIIGTGEITTDLDFYVV
jgi:CRISPR-associated protein Cas2